MDDSRFILIMISYINQIKLLSSILIHTQLNYNRNYRRVFFILLGENGF